MLDLKWIRKHTSEVKLAIQEKGVHCDLEGLLRVDAEVLAIKKTLQQLEQEKNVIAKKVPSLQSSQEKKSYIERGRELHTALEKERGLLREKEQALQFHLWTVPNVPALGAPRGRSDEENQEIKKIGKLPQLEGRGTRSHVDLIRENDWGELDRVAKVAGTRSYVLKNELAMLEMAILQSTLQKLQKKGFTIMTLPAFSQEAPLYGTGHFPTGRDQVYFLPEEKMYLVGTAEVPLNFLHSGELLAEKNLPLLYAGFSSCFRREAGSAGRDTRGLMRVHQFLKVEQFVLCKSDPAEAQFWHQRLLENAEEIMQDLELPYRILDVCTGDMGAGKVRQYDIEAWVPSENRYRETHSCSSLHDWQARRSDLRYRQTDGTVSFCFTLNNTAVASPRILVPFLENHQQQDGSIFLPPILRPYFENEVFLRPRKRNS